MPIIFDLKGDGGVVALVRDGIDIREMCACDPARYTETPPAGTLLMGGTWISPSSKRDETPSLPVIFEPKDGRCRVVIWDLLDPSGPTETLLHAIDARDALARSPEQYVRELPPGVRAGPKCGKHRVIRA